MLRNEIDFSRNSFMKCVYCVEITRNLIFFKLFLDLFILPVKVLYVFAFSC